MDFIVEGMTFEGFALVANLGDWAHATTGACMRVEYGLVFCRYFLVAEVGHGRGLDVNAPIGISNLMRAVRADKNSRLRHDSVC